MPRTGFTDEDRENIQTLLAKMTGMEKSMNSMKADLKKTCDDLKDARQVIVKQTKTINYLHTRVNVANYNTDATNQYGRRECFDVLGTEGLGNDAEKIIQDIAKEIEDKSREAAENDSTKTPFT